MSTTVQSDRTVDLGERCHALEQECDELRERVARLENPPAPPRRRVRAIVADGLFVLLGGLVVAAIAGGVAIAAGVWKLNSEPSEDAVQAAPPTTVAQSPSENGPFAGGSVTTQGVTAETSAAEDGVATEGTAAVPVRFVASAVGGDCWLQVRRGSAEGEVLWEGILVNGTSEEFDGERFWIRMGDPTNLRLDVNGERVVELPSLAADMLITESGASVVPTG